MKYVRGGHINQYSIAGLFKVRDSEAPLRELNSMLPPLIIITIITVIVVALYVPHKLKKVLNNKCCKHLKHVCTFLNIFLTF